MAQIREIKRRIKSITNTQKATHAMELVSGAKMRKAQEQALSSRPYTYTLNEILAQVRAKSQSTHTLLMPKDSPNQMIILITTDRGLVGGLNINLFREITKGELKNLKFVVVGKKGQNFVVKTNSDLIAGFETEKQDVLELARTLSKIATDAYKNGEVSKVAVLYPDFKSTIAQIPTITQILPIELENVDDSQSTIDNGQLLFEPSADQILENILPHYVLTKIYQTLLEAKASEHSARMVAMKNATDAAKDLVSDLTLTYNQARQEAITTELLDIITAQSAFE